MAISSSACRLPACRSGVKNHAWSVGTETYPRTVTLPSASTVNSTSSPSPTCRTCRTSSGKVSCAFWRSLERTVVRGRGSCLASALFMNPPNSCPRRAVTRRGLRTQVKLMATAAPTATVQPLPFRLTRCSPPTGTRRRRPGRCPGTSPPCPGRARTGRCRTTRTRSGGTAQHRRRGCRRESRLSKAVPLGCCPPRAH